MAITPFVSPALTVSARVFIASSGDPKIFCFTSWAETGNINVKPQSKRRQPLLKHNVAYNLFLFFD